MKKMFRVAALLAVLGVLTSCQSENQEISRNSWAAPGVYLTEASSFVVIMHKM